MTAAAAVLVGFAIGSAGMGWWLNRRGRWREGSTSMLLAQVGCSLALVLLVLGGSACAPAAEPEPVRWGACDIEAGGPCNGAGAG